MIGWDVGRQLIIETLDTHQEAGPRTCRCGFDTRDTRREGGWDAVMREHVADALIDTLRPA